MDAYIPGDYYCYCDRCGFKTRRSQTRKTWDGLIVCAADWEPRHPQDRVRAQAERQTVRDARLEPEYVFLESNEVTASDL